MANTTPIVTTVTKPATNPGREKTPRDADATYRVNIYDFCEEYYEDILPIIMDKIRWYHNQSERLKVQDRLRYNDRHVLDRLGHRRQSAYDRLSETYSPSTTKSRPDMTSLKDRSRNRSRPHRRDSSNGDRSQSRDCSRDRGRDSESPLSRASKSGSSDGGHWKSKSKRHKPTDEDDLTMSWMCEEVDPFTPRIRNFKSSRKTRMPNNVKTYDGTGDPEDHVKIFQAAAYVERWLMPTWCHMFNSTLIGAARVCKRCSQSGMYADLMERFKVETGRMKGAPECMRISRFMHGVNNLELTKRLNENVPKTMEEMMITTTAFIRGEAVVAGKKKGKFQSPPPMVIPVEKRNSNKFCDFHNDKEHSTDECMQLKKQIEELKVTQSFERVREITFPSLATSSGTEGPLIIESEIGGHMIHRMYVDGCSLTEDCYPLLKIDWKVESLCGYPFKCFLDAYKGYHQIQLVESDEEKRLSTPAKGFIAIQKCLSASRTLVPRTSGSAVEGMFLGYMITPEGMKPCPDKTEAVLQLPSPRIIKEGDSLDASLLRKLRITGPETELYPNGKASSITSFRGQEASEDDYKNKASCWENTISHTGQEPSNNEAEYEALIAGLRIAAQMGVQNVHVSVDSKLVANQVLGAYVSKEENMIKYLEKVKSLLCALIQTGLGRNTQRKIHTREGGDNRGRGRWTNMDDTNNRIFERKDSSRFRIKARQYELLEGVLYSMHSRPWSVVAKAIRLGYYWPTMHGDARDMIRACNDCQIHRPVTRNPKHPLTSITAPWPFYKWGIDIAGPFLDGPERANRSLGEEIKACLGEGNKNWIEELPHVLWAHRTIIKSSHGDTPFSMTYGTKAVIPAEIGMPTYRTAAVDTLHNDEEIRLNLDLLEERRERATIREAKSKLKMTKYYNARVRGVLSGQATLSTVVTTLVMLWMEGSSVRSGKDLTRYRKHWEMEHTN
nr:hypothetical protein [Tanacetum cinerariifolium]